MTPHRLQHGQSVGVSEDRLGAALGMRHQAEDVARGVADRGDVARRAVRVRIGRLSPRPWEIEARACVGCSNPEGESEPRVESASSESHSDCA